MSDPMYMHVDEVIKRVPKMVVNFQDDREVCDAVLKEALYFCQYWGAKGSHAVVMSLLGRIKFDVYPDDLLKDENHQVMVSFIPGDDESFKVDPKNPDHWQWCYVAFWVSKRHLEDLSLFLRSTPELKADYAQICEGKLECPNPKTFVQ